MATVDKNFRIKNGLAVEGTTATVNGENILREGSGDSYIIDLIGGQATSANTANAVVKRDGSGNFAAGNITVSNGVTSTGNLDITANGYAQFIVTDGAYVNEDEIVTKTATQDISNKRVIDTLYFTDGVTISNEGEIAVRSGSHDFDVQANYGDVNLKTIAAGADVNISSQSGNINLNPDGNVFINGSTAADQVATQGYVDDAAYDAKSDAEGYTDARESVLRTDYAAADAALAGQLGQSIQDVAVSTEANAASYTDGLISSEVTARNNAISTAKGEAIADANAYTDGKVADLVDSAPDLLNTLDELAQAIAANPNYATDVANLVATKADTSYVDSEITDARSFASGEASDAYTNAVSAAAQDATGKANTAQSNAENTAQNALDDVLDGTTAFAEINVNDLVSQRAAQGLVALAQTGSSMMSWAKSDYGTAKAWVKFATGTHSQISEFLLTTDSSGNIAITEFGMVTSNGILGSVGASYLNGNIAIEVDTVHASTTVTVVATLIK